MTSFVVKKKSPHYKIAFKGFIITLAFSLSLLTAQFILKWGNDLSRANLEAFTIIKLTILASLSLLTLALPISVLSGSAIYFRRKIKDGSAGVKKKVFMLFVTSLALLSFLWVAFIAPTLDLHFTGLLFDVQNKAYSKEPMKRTNLDLFRGSPMTCNYFDLNEKIDFSVHAITKIRTQVIRSLKANVSDRQINELLNEESARQIGIVKGDFKIPDDKRYAFHNENTDSLRYFKSLLYSAASQIENENGSMTQMKIKLWKMLAFPCLILLTLF